MSEPLDAELRALIKKDQVLASLEKMFACPTRGICLLHEWLRRYGQPDSNCACFNRFSEWVVGPNNERQA